MHPPFSLEFAEGLFFWSNVFYVMGAVLTLASAGLILYTRRAQAIGISVPRFMLTEAAVFLPACVSLLGSVGAIYFSSVVLNLERAALGHGRVRPAVLLGRTDPSAFLAPPSTEHRTEPDSSPSATVADRSLLTLRDNGSATARSDSLDAPRGSVDPQVSSVDLQADGLDAQKRPILQRKTAAARAASSPVGTPAGQPDVLGAPPVAPRTLDTGAEAVTALHSYQGMKATVETGSDPEASALADHVLVVLLANGIDARNGASTSVLHQLSGRPGVHIRYLDTDRGRDLADALAALMRHSALAVDVGPSWDLAVGTPPSRIGAVTPEQILISVGPKP